MSKEEIKKSQAFQLGWIAFDQGLSLEANPFLPGNQQYLEWQRGFKAAEEFPPTPEDVSRYILKFKPKQGK